MSVRQRWAGHAGLRSRYLKWPPGPVQWRRVASAIAVWLPLCGSIPTMTIVILQLHTEEWTAVGTPDSRYELLSSFEPHRGGPPAIPHLAIAICPSD
jgi:hypothetical protein